MGKWGLDKGHVAKSKHYLAFLSLDRTTSFIIRPSSYLLIVTTTESDIHRPFPWLIWTKSNTPKVFSRTSKLSFDGAFLTNNTILLCRSELDKSCLSDTF